ncbi:IclR family transcriptional regulator [Streptomyces sp. NPDC087440]|uniref:IclR family transcriptional regulator n=1 Tax=Streptomyces sp. NPDC087440 TaxID=3365790 RepID=UPI0038145E0B
MHGEGDTSATVTSTTYSTRIAADHPVTTYATATTGHHPAAPNSSPPSRAATVASRRMTVRNRSSAASANPATKNSLPVCGVPRGAILSRMSGHATGSSYRERNTTADRALDILGLFTDERPVLSGIEVATALGVAKSTAYRYLQSLVTNRFLEEAPGGGFRLGLRVLELARVARRSYGLSDIALPTLTKLAEAVHETVLLTRRVGDLVVCLDRAESQTHRVRISYERGMTLPINAGASALVLLAWSPADEVEALLRGADLRAFTPATLTEVPDIMERLEQIRGLGHAVARSELDHDVLGVAAPVFGDGDTVVAAVSVAAVGSRTSKVAEAAIVESVQKAAREIGERVRTVES